MKLRAWLIALPAALVLPSPAAAGEALPAPRVDDSVAGFVLDSGRPVPGARVVAMPDSGPPGAPDADPWAALERSIGPGREAPIETGTDAEGAFALSGLEGRWCAVRVLVRGKAAKEVRAVPVPTRRLEISLAPAEAVSVRVLDDRSSTPIRDATVSAHAAPPQAGDAAETALALERPPLERVVAGEDGVCRFEMLGPGTYGLSVLAPGNRARWLPSVSVPAGGIRLDDVRLARGLTLGGVVRGPDGAPLRDVEVIVEPETAPGEPVPALLRDERARTGPEGRFSFDTLADLAHLLVARHPALASVARPGVRPGASDADVTLRPGEPLGGSVVRSGDGGPVSGAVVRAWDVGRHYREATTDATGRFTVTGLAPSSKERRVDVRAPGFAAVVGRSVPAHGSVRVLLDRHGSLAGSVRTTGGDPIAGATVTVFRVDRDIEHPIAALGVAADGGFLVDRLRPEDLLVVRAVREGHAAGSSERFSVRQGDRLSLPPIVLPRLGALTGRVVSEGAATIEGCAIRVEAPGVLRSAVTDALGRFDVPALPPGAYALRAQAKDRLRRDREVRIDEGETSDAGTLVLPLGPTLEGRVERPEGGPAAGALVLARFDPFEELRTESDEDGRFRFEGLPTSDRVAVAARHEDYSPSDAVRVAPDARGVVIRLRPLAAIRGTVRLPHGLAATRFTVRPVSTGDPEEGRALPRKLFASPEGAFEYLGVPPGTYQVELRAAGLLVARAPCVVESPTDRIDLGAVALRRPTEGGIIAGVVLFEGHPVPGALVQVAEGAAAFDSPRRPARQVTEGDGLFGFAGLDLGRVTVRVECAGFRSQTLRNVPSLEPPGRDLVVRLER